MLYHELEIRDDLQTKRLQFWSPCAQFDVICQIGTWCLNHSGSWLGTPFWNINKHFIPPTCVWHWKRNWSQEENYVLGDVLLHVTVLVNSLKELEWKYSPNQIKRVFKQILFYFSGDPVYLLPFLRHSEVGLMVVNHWGIKALKVWSLTAHALG